MLRKLYLTGFVAYLFMLMLSLFFYEERTIFLDMAFNLFYIINKGGFAIQIFRFGDVFSQLPPFFAVKAGMPLAFILQAYSAGFVMLYGILYFICGTVCKRYDFALVILLLNILFATDTFYWMLSQLPQAIAILTALFALASRNRLQATGAGAWFLLIAGMMTVVFFHPLIVFVLSFAIGFFLLGSCRVVDRKMCVSLLSVYVAGMVVKFLFFRTPYEAHSLSGMKNFFRLFPNYFTIYSNKRFLFSLLTKYYWLAISLVAVTIYYCKGREWRKLALVASFFGGYLLLVNVSYPTAETPAFYIENLYLPLAIFVSFPLIFDMLPAARKPAVPQVALVLIILSAATRIYMTHTLYTDRLAYERKILDEYGDRKVIVQATQKDRDALLMIWGTPYELLLLSELERHKPASVIIDEKPELRIWSGSQEKTLVVNYNLIPYNRLNTTYFQLPDTLTIYSIIQDRPGRH